MQPFDSIGSAAQATRLFRHIPLWDLTLLTGYRSPANVSVSFRESMDGIECRTNETYRSESA